VSETIVLETHDQLIFCGSSRSFEVVGASTVTKLSTDHFD